MKYLVQIDFKSDGPFGEEKFKEKEDLAKSINNEPGVIWKIWTENAETKESGGVYLFESKETAQKFLEMHSARLKSYGFDNIRAKIFEVHEKLSLINKAPITVCQKKHSQKND
ncbi:monooxygenase [Neobacillus notoginsengisoli]|uniref:Monooxygenase n=1 Tax=Neobacillus notoginsengisoli TaxID=1578198 RepID=A0A417YSV5_9BACI|nr:monooxygenase [Neobacillus notoginsengisoli]RHW39062.1 monooxygenase [Neobacillus notoginsengisoli]